MAFGQYNSPPPSGTDPSQPGGYASGQNNWYSVGGSFGSGGSSSNPENYYGQSLPTYGGYAGGFGNTMAMEGSLAHQAQNAKAAHANFSAANPFYAAQSGYQNDQGQLAGSMGHTAGQLKALAAGHGLSAADYGVPSALSGNIAGAQAAGGANPLAARAAMAGMGSANTGVSAGYGAGMAGTMQGAQSGLTGTLGAQGGVYGQQGGQSVSAAQLAGQQAAYNPGLQAQQNNTNDMTALGYTNAGLGLQQNEQGLLMQSQSDINQYNLALQGLANQSNNQMLGAAASAGGALMAAV